MTPSRETRLPWEHCVKPISDGVAVAQEHDLDVIAADHVITPPSMVVSLDD